MFGAQRSNQQQTTSFNSSANDGNQQLQAIRQQKAFPQTQTQFGIDRNSNGYQNLSGATIEEKGFKANQPSEYQSILMTRFLKEPRLPPSSTYYNNNSRKKKSTVSRGSKPQIFANRTGGTTFYQNDASDQKSVKESQSPSKMMSHLSTAESRRPRKNIGQQINGKGEISYRNQNEIMKKIFGNEQNYHQVKNLLVKGPYQQEESSLLQKYQPQSMSTKQQYISAETNQAARQEYQQAVKPQTSPLANKPRLPQGLFDRRSTGGFVVGNNNLAKQTYGDEPRSPIVGLDKIILAKSLLQERAELQQTPTLKTERHSVAQSATPVNGGNDQVEKAIFDLQDVKNNYFQEKNAFDVKIQQIQNKQNLTMSNGFGLMHATSYNRTATASFLPTSGGQRPLTQGGLILKNQHLMNDNNVLKSELEQISKEDLRERLVVAEMVMKKLFQRNKDLEDQAIAVREGSRERENSSKTEVKRPRSSHSHIGSPKVSDDFKSIEVFGDLKGNNLPPVDCKQCFEVRKEMTNRENEMQDRINELQSLLLKKTETIGKANHFEYLQLRLEETMTEAKRHFSNYISVRNMYNTFLESRLNSNHIQGGMKGQKIHNDILSMLKKNLESAELALIQEKDQLKLTSAKTQVQLTKKDKQLSKREKMIKQLNDEIERRKFVESKVQKYVKGLIGQNQRHTNFLERLKDSKVNMVEAKRQIDEFIQDNDNRVEDDGGESTENEDDELQNSGTGISIEVNDL